MPDHPGCFPQADWIFRSGVFLSPNPLCGASESMLRKTQPHARYLPFVVLLETEGDRIGDKDLDFHRSLNCLSLVSAKSGSKVAQVGHLFLKSSAELFE